MIMYIPSHTLSYLQGLVAERSEFCHSVLVKKFPVGTKANFTRAFVCTAYTYVFLDGVAIVPQPGRFDVTYNVESEGTSIYELIL